MSTGSSTTSATTLPRSGRERDGYGRFAGPRVNVEQVPRLPTFPARWVLEDPRQRPYLVFWVSPDDGTGRWALKMEPSYEGDAVIVTLADGATQRVGLLRRPLPRGTSTALFYRCSWCQKPRRYLYLLALSGTKLVSDLGLRCQACARLRFGSQGRYRSAFSVASSTALGLGMNTRASWTSP